MSSQEKGEGVVYVRTLKRCPATSSLMEIYEKAAKARRRARAARAGAMRSDSMQGGDGAGPVPTRRDNINNLAYYLDRDDNGMISLANLDLAFDLKYDPRPAGPAIVQSTEESESIYNAEDFIKPLKYLFELKNEKPEQVLARYDTDKSYLLSGKELAAMLRFYTSLTLTNYEILLLQNFLKKKFGRTEIKRDEFGTLISLKFERVYEKKKAKAMVAFLQQYLHEEHGPDPGGRENVAREEDVRQLFKEAELPDETAATTSIMQGKSAPLTR